MTESKPYFFYDGIKEVAAKFKGNENIYLGIRPYGFHAGNKIPFIIYPLLLCEETKKLGKPVKYTFFLFLNDWEQDGFDQTYTDIKTHPFNVIPKYTTFQFTSYDEGGGNIVNHWESIIVDQTNVIRETYPDVSLRCVRNSYMRDFPIMKHVVLKTIQNPDLVGNVLRETTQREILEHPYGYCRPICPKCKSAKTNGKVINEDDISITCDKCGLEKTYNYHLLYFWLYHKPLALPRIKEYNINLCITGTDHYNEGDFTSRKRLFDVYDIPINMPDTIYTSALYGKNGLPMGKSKGNYEDLPVEFLMNLVKNNKNENKIYLS